MYSRTKIIKVSQLVQLVHSYRAGASNLRDQKSVLGSGGVENVKN